MSDACERTHTHVRARARGGTVVHAQDPDIRRWAWAYATACGLHVWKSEGVRTGEAITCQRPGCVRQMMIELGITNGPPVDRPGGPYEGDAAKYN
jgi:hypothetical protein